MQCVSWLWTVFWPSSDYFPGELKWRCARYSILLEIAILRGDLEQIANWVEAPWSSSKRPWPWSKSWNPLMINLGGWARPFPKEAERGSIGAWLGQYLEAGFRHDWGSCLLCGCTVSCKAWGSTASCEILSYEAWLGQTASCSRVANAERAAIGRSRICARLFTAIQHIFWFGLTNFQLSIITLSYYLYHDYHQGKKPNEFYPTPMLLYCITVRQPSPCDVMGPSWYL
jgi:hypothetical protein